MRTLALGLLTIFIAVSAEASLQVFPTRVLLTDGAPSAQLSVRNKSDKPTNYKISLVFYEMKPDGSMALLTETKGLEVSAIDHIKFSPRKVTLKPEEEQVVRILAHRVPSLSDGEYRAHIYFESMDDPQEIPMGTADQKSAQLFLKARMAIAVPIVIRHGVTTAKATLSDLKLVTLPDKTFGFSAQLKKEGNRNLYGDLRLTWVKPSGEELEVGLVKGGSSYIETRSVTYPLQVQDAEVYKAGTLKIEFRAPSADGAELLADASSAKLEPAASAEGAASDTTSHQPASIKAESPSQSPQQSPSQSLNLPPNLPINQLLNELLKPPPDQPLSQPLAQPLAQPLGQ